MEMLNDAFGILEDGVGLGRRDSTMTNIDGSLEEDNIKESHPIMENFKKLIDDANMELYPRCKHFNKLSFILHLYNLKCRYGLPNEFMGDLIKLLKLAFPEDKSDDVCSVYGASCWKSCENDSNNDASNKNIRKKKNVPAKVSRHFPLKHRLQRLFMSSKTSDLVRWHDKDRVKDGVLRHSTDSDAWKHFDSLYPEFANDPCWNISSCFACPSCNVDTCSKQLKKGKIFGFMGYRRFLNICHSDSKSFDGTREFRAAPKVPSGLEVLEQFKDIRVAYGKNNKEVSGVREKTWKKRSIFFELPYWKFNLLRHNFDVMHVEKNVCDNVVNTLLNVDKKSKDGLSAHEKKLFYEVLENVKFLDGYASNISRP
ncbi:uncharacterized protein LOC126672594 [Mercurialis annua]|uniref:uncharacterized protein LOC126672594 n=1 Tax=Mercurialis annua TaxID=3986 RepID=UPI00216002DA|nr:uncharacterized protein LOC126672594 [Mercurialis annua]